MENRIVMAIALIITGAEIFFNFFTISLSKVISLSKKNFEFSQKVKNSIKLVVIGIFLISSIYFMIEFVEVLASWFGIPLDKRLIDFFK